MERLYFVLRRKYGAMDANRNTSEKQRVAASNEVFSHPIASSINGIAKPDIAPAAGMAACFIDNMRPRRCVGVSLTNK